MTDWPRWQRGRRARGEVLTPGAMGFYCSCSAMSTNPIYSLLTRKSYLTNRLCRSVNSLGQEEKKMHNMVLTQSQKLNLNRVLLNWHLSCTKKSNLNTTLLRLIPFEIFWFPRCDRNSTAVRSHEFIYNNTDLMICSNS